MARKLTPAQIATKAAKNSGLKNPGKPKRGRKTAGAAPRKRRPVKAIPASKQTKPLNATIPGEVSGGSRKLYKFDFGSNAASYAQIAGICLAGLAFFGIIYAVVRHAYANRPSHAQAIAQAAEYEKAVTNCGKKPYLVVTATNTYGEQSVDYYSPGFESYETRVKEVPSAPQETKRFDCQLDGALIAYATPHYAESERADIAKIYKDYAASKGMKFMAPAYMPDGYSLLRQTVSSNSYHAAFSATGDEEIDGYFTACSLLRDAPDRSKMSEYRNAEHTLFKQGTVTVYGDHNFTIENTPEDVARYAETGDMWCSFTQIGERFISNDDISKIMGSFAAQPDDFVLKAVPVATE